MRKCYIGVGGLGCKLLREFEESAPAGARYIYIDVVQGDLDCLGDGEHYALDRQKDSYIFRGIGKDSIRAAIYRGKMPDFVDSFFLEGDLDLTYVLSAFGGFGSAVIFDLVDYYGVKIRDRRSANGLEAGFSCRVIAFPMQCFPYLQMAPRMAAEPMELNEVEFINEFRQMGFRSDRWYQQRADCFPCIELYVPRLEGDRLSDMIGLPDSQLRLLDTKSAYYYSVAPKASDAEVFISYSSKDQAVADRIVDAARRRGIGCWIATDSIRAGSYARQIVQGIRRAKLFVVVLSKNAIASPHVKNELDIATSRIREGLAIMPFKIDDAELDDECRYYLCRQEFFPGQKPPIEERIEQFVDSIEAALRN